MIFRAFVVSKDNGSYYMCTMCIILCVCLHRELLEKIAHFEEQELSLTAGGSLHKHRQLDPLNSMGGEKLLQMVRERRERGGSLIAPLAGNRKAQG